MNIYSVFLTYFESLCRSSLGDRLDKLANIVTTIVVPCSCLRHHFTRKRFVIQSGDPVKAICLINKDDAI